MANAELSTVAKTDPNFQDFSWFARSLFQFGNKILEQGNVDVQISGDRDTDIRILRKRAARRFVKYALGFDRCAAGEMAATDFFPFP